MKEIDELDLGLLGVGAVGVMGVRWMLGWELVGGAGWRKIDEPHAGDGVTQPDNGGDTVLDDAGVVAVQEYIVAPVITELAKGN